MSGTVERLRYAFADLGYALGRAGRAVSRGLSGFWFGLSLTARRRLAAALGIAALALLFFGLALPNLPCQLPGGDSCPPADDAERLIPADALAYVHANVDPETEQAELAREVAGRVPVFSGQLVGRALAELPASAGASADFETEVQPWLAGEVALAAVAGAGRPELVELLEVADPEAAGEYASAIAAGTPESEQYAEIELSVDERGLASAQVAGFLAIGTRDGVREVIDVATDAEGSSALADDEGVSELRDQLPEHRLAEAYLSEDGARELIGSARGTLGTLTPLIAPGATTGAAGAVVATEEGLELSVRSELDPERAQAAPGFFAAFPSFDPGLPERLAPDSLAYLGLGEPSETISALLAQASAEAPRIAAGFEELVASLRREGEIDIERELLDALGGEAAFAIAPRESAAGEALPYLEFVADDVDEEAARRALAALQGPLADAVDPVSGLQAPVFGSQQLGGVEARSLRVTPTVELTYAVFDGLAAIATDPAAISRLAAGEGGLDQAETYERATDELLDGEVSLLAFFDLAELVAIGERLGLAEDPVYATFAGEFRRLEALGIAIADSDELLVTEARLLISEAEPGGGDPGSIAPPAD